VARMMQAMLKCVHGELLNMTLWCLCDA